MNLRNVQLVWHRELRDQLRDKRSLFMVAVLPMLLYPMLGATAFQLSPLLKKHASKVLIIGAERLEGVDPPLFVDGHFDWGAHFPEPVGVDLDLEFQHADSTDDNKLRQAQEKLSRGELDVVVYIPPGLAERIAVLQLPDAQRGKESTKPPQPTVYCNLSRDASQIGQRRVQIAIDAWQSRIVRGNLAARNVPENVATPFGIATQDVASPGHRQAAMWARLLPFVVFVWALTGAFYPAVDLCAGEKERGTLEALLSSPALRSEIVSGKLLTVITFSIASALANLGSMALTGKVLIDQLNAIPSASGAALDAPPLAAIAWLLVALIPMATLFSALSLAVAAYARSTKEGQYYLMPLLLGSLPLMVFPVIPSVELNLGTSLIPIAGMVLVLRTAIEGNAEMALPFLPGVALVTLGCCWLAIRWAVMQFNSESVLFRESDNFSPGLWFRKLYIDRPNVPAGGAAIACIVAIYFAQFLAKSAGVELTTSGIVKLVLLSQACILLPTMALTWFLSRHHWQTLKLVWPRAWWHLPAGVLLALLLHPVGLQLRAWITQVYPMPEGLNEMFAQAGGFPLGLALLLIAVLPGICEELAFRGFVLSGLQKSVGPIAAVGISALAFGFAHGLLQQNILASVLGVVLGIVALQTGSLLPGVLFHITYNALNLLRVAFSAEFERAAESMGFSHILGGVIDKLPVYSPLFTAICAVLAAGLLWAICRGRSANQSTELGNVAKFMPAAGDENR